MVHRDTRQALIDAAADVIARRGVEAASTREIYALAGVKAPTLYHHFGDKQGLLDAVVTDAFERYLAAKRALPPSGGDAAAAIRQGWDLHVSFALGNPALYRLMWPGHANLPPAAAESARSLHEGFARLERKGALRAGITPRDAARTLSAALSGVTAAITRDPADPGNELLSVTVRDAVIDALLTPSATGPPRAGDQADDEDQPDDDQPEER